MCIVILNMVFHRRDALLKRVEDGVAESLLGQHIGSLIQRFLDAGMMFVYPGLVMLVGA